MRRICAVLVCLSFGSLAAAQGVAPVPLRVTMISGSEEYRSDESLAASKEHLERNYQAFVTLVRAVDNKDLPGIEALGECDVALFFTRRLTTDGEQLEAVKRYVLSGRPIVAIRTASHGFQNWLEFDKLVLGGNYHGHLGAGVPFTTGIAPEAKNHPILKGVGPIATTASLYRNQPIAGDVAVLMTGETAKSEGPEPVAWVRQFKGARVFYTSLGAPADFGNDDFRRMLANALFWTAGRVEAVRKEAHAKVAKEQRNATEKVALAPWALHGTKPIRRLPPLLSLAPLRPSRERF